MTTDSAALAKLAVETCESRKAEKVSLYGMEGKSVLADYYLICSGQSEPQINAIAGALHHLFSEHGMKPKSIQGTPQSHWIIMDYGFILIHIFIVVIILCIVIFQIAFVFKSFGITAFFIFFSASAGT